MSEVSVCVWWEGHKKERQRGETGGPTILPRLHFNVIKIPPHTITILTPKLPTGIPLEDRQHSNHSTGWRTEMPSGFFGGWNELGFHSPDFYTV
jgi:hypothetical protein